MTASASEEGLAAAAVSEWTTRVVTLTRWVGAGRKLTQTGRLTLAHARELVELLDTGDVIDPQTGGQVYRTKSSEELPELNTVLEWARAARLVRVTGGRLATVQTNAKLLERPLPLWERMFETFGALGPAVCPPGWGESMVRSHFAEGIRAVLAGIYAHDGPVSLTEACTWAWEAVSRGYRIADAPDSQRDTWRRCNDRDVHGAMGVLARFGAVRIDGQQEAMSVALTPLGRRGMRRALGEPEPGAPVLQVKTTLLETAEPVVWRRLLVPADIRLGRLHTAIQAAMGWQGYHMHCFTHGDTRYSLPDRELGFRDERATTLAKLLTREGDRIGYTYDFGDGWEHELVLERFGGAEPDTRYPISGVRCRWRCLPTRGLRWGVRLRTAPRGPGRRVERRAREHAGVAGPGHSGRVRPGEIRRQRSQPGAGRHRRLDRWRRMRPRPSRGPRNTMNGSGVICGPVTGDDDAGTGGCELVEWHMLAGVHDLLAARDVPARELAEIDARTDTAVGFLRRLVVDGMMPTPQLYLSGLLQRFHTVLRRGCDPSRAELLACEFLGELGSTTPDTAQADDAVSRSLVELMSRIEACGTREALAALRALAVVAAPPVLTAACAAAGRLAAGGLQDPTWVEGIGAPVVGACYGYLDPAGGQETVVATFAYPGRKPHGLAVLIDHNLGGGAKDCWVSGTPEQTRRDYRQVADRHGLEFFEYPPGHARSVLERALECQPCPVAADQVSDVRDFLPLLRQRMALLPSGNAAPVRIPASRQTGAVRLAATRVAGSGVHRLKVTLRGAKPPIWRRLEVPSQITLARLHQVIQTAFGWYGCHLWVFETPAGEYGQPDSELGHADAAAVTLDAVAPGVGDQIRYVYVYDFGDDWRHDIVVEDVVAAQPGTAYPRCVAGRRARPPEDCGGMRGYTVMLEILADADHPDHVETPRGLCLPSADAFDPARFDRDAVNASLAAWATVAALEHES